MESLVDVNGDLIGYLDDGFIRRKEDVENFTITYDCSKDEGVTICYNDLVTHDYSESVTVCDVIEETTSDTTYYLDDDFNIFMTDNFGNMISLNKIRKDKNGKYCRC